MHKHEERRLKENREIEEFNRDIDRSIARMNTSIAVNRLLLGLLTLGALFVIIIDGLSLLILAGSPAAFLLAHSTYSSEKHIKVITGLKLCQLH